MKNLLGKDQAKEVANEILNQLGGNRFCAMTGAKDLMILREERGGIQMKIGRNSAGRNRVRIVLNDLDLYDVSFEAVRMNRKTYEQTVKVKAEFKGLFFDSLVSTFEETTGLHTSL